MFFSIRNTGHHRIFLFHCCLSKIADDSSVICNYIGHLLWLNLSKIWAWKGLNGKPRPRTNTNFLSWQLPLNSMKWRVVGKSMGKTGVALLCCFSLIFILKSSPFSPVGTSSEVFSSQTLDHSAFFIILLQSPLPPGDICGWDQGHLLSLLVCIWSWGSTRASLSWWVWELRSPLVCLQRGWLTLLLTHNNWF